MSQQQSPNLDPARKPGLWASIAYFVGVAALVSLVYWLAPDADQDSPVTVASETTTTTTTTAVTSDANLDVETSPAAPAGEPIADAAEVILPSVVHLQTEAGLGSGVIYDSNGLIVTAAHVVAGNETVTVRFDNGDQVQGRVVGAATDVDIAVIEVDRADLPAATFASEKPRVGQVAIAVGSPWNLESTVTAGIISAVDRTTCTGGGVCASVLQTDAAINPGNSGGALVDRHGEVVGINVAIFTQSGANDGVGFAVPADIAMDYAASIVSGEPLDPAFLGVRGDFADEADRAGALITEVIPDTSADQAGIEVGDLIIEVDGVAVRGLDDLVAQVRAHRPGDVVDVLLIRDGEEMIISITLGSRPEDIG